MAVYLESIKFAIMIFPIIAFLITLPFLIFHYQKYGAIPFLRGVITYTFILYLMIAFFLVILPLPSKSAVLKMPSYSPQLQPFYFIQNIKETTRFVWNDFSTYFSFFHRSTVYTVIFNLMLTIPFGVYLAYYFNKKWYHVIFYSFFLSLFFEITQLTGIYGIYPKAYRLFDVDDLILNTLGGLLGYFIAPLVTILLPSRKELDEVSYQKGQCVSIYRRAVALFIDLFFIISCYIILNFFIPNILFFPFLSYFCLLPLIWNGKTIGKRIVNIRISYEKKRNLLLRQILFSFLLLPSPFYIFILFTTSYSNNITHFIKIFLIVLLFVYDFYFLFELLTSLLKNEKQFYYEKITKTKNESTIHWQEGESMIK